MRRLLRRKGFAGGAIAAALERLSDLGYVDDARYAASFISTIGVARSWGPHRVRRELLKRGVPRALVEEAMARSDAGDPRSGIDRALEKAIRLRGVPADRRSRDRLMAALRRQGYPAGEIVRALRRRLERGEEPREEA